jgi:hypothetical protein
MLGSTFTITLDGSGGTAKVLPLINQDGYTSEYFLDESTQWFRAKVRHLTETVKAGTQPYARHSVVMQRFVKPTEAIPLGRLSEVTHTIRMDPSDVASDVIDVSEAMSFYMVKAGGIAAKLLGWES